MRQVSWVCWVLTGCLLSPLFEEIASVCLTVALALRMNGTIEVSVHEDSSHIIEGFGNYLPHMKNDMWEEGGVKEACLSIVPNLNSCGSMSASWGMLPKLIPGARKLGEEGLSSIFNTFLGSLEEIRA